MIDFDEFRDLPFEQENIIDRRLSEAVGVIKKLRSVIPTQDQIADPTPLTEQFERLERAIDHNESVVIGLVGIIASFRYKLRGEQLERRKAKRKASRSDAQAPDAANENKRKNEVLASRTFYEMCAETAELMEKIQPLHERIRELHPASAPPSTEETP